MINLPAISDFLSETVGESLKKPLQPAMLFAAAVFSFLNLVLVVIPLSEVRSAADSAFVRAATAFLALDTIWQGVLAAVFVVVLAYVLLSLNSTIFRLMTGELWGDSPLLGRLFKAVQKMKCAALETAMKHERESGKDVWQAHYERHTHFPKDPAQIAPTALGNRLNATASYLWDRYGIDMTALWPHMRIVIADKATLKGRLDDDKAALDFLLNLSFVLGVFALEFLLILWWPTSQGKPPNFLLTPWGVLLFLALAWGMYRAAVVKARSWTQAIRMAFDSDQNREDLRKLLGLRDFKGSKDERGVWERVSGWLLWGNPYGNIFDLIPSSPEATATHSANVQVKLASTVVSLPTEEEEGLKSDTVTGYKQVIKYAALVSNPVVKDVQPQYDATGVSVIVSEPRVAWIDKLPAGATAIPPQKLLWKLDPLPPNAATTVEYELPIPIWKAETNKPKLTIAACEIVLAKSKDGCHSYKFTLKNEGSYLAKEQGTLSVFDTRLKKPSFYQRVGVAVKGTRIEKLDCVVLAQPAGYRWVLPSLRARQSMIVHYTLREKTSA